MNSPSLSDDNSQITFSQEFKPGNTDQIKKLGQRNLLKKTSCSGKATREALLKENKTKKEASSKKNLKQFYRKPRDNRPVDLQKHYLLMSNGNFNSI